MKFEGMRPWAPSVGIVGVETYRGWVDLYNESSLLWIKIDRPAHLVCVSFSTPLGFLELSFRALESIEVAIERGALDRVDFSQVDMFEIGSPDRSRFVLYLTNGEIDMEAAGVCALFVESSDVERVE
ncbi:hypothetical protein ACWFNS_08915 [Oerskovia enterophila]